MTVAYTPRFTFALKSTFHSFIKPNTMKRLFLLLFLSLGWILLAIFLISGYYYNKLSLNDSVSKFHPIAWEDHLQIFDGAVQCKLVGDDLLERKKVLKEQIFSNVSKKRTVHNGYVYYFHDRDLLLQDALEFVKCERECCPFFKFDISILPFDQGFAIQISGSEAAFEMLSDFESSDI